jgi:hypothetical protein
MNKALSSTLAALAVCGLCVGCATRSSTSETGRFEAVAQTNVTHGKMPQARAFPRTGIASADLDPTFQQLKKLLPQTNVTVVDMQFLNPDSALVTVRTLGHYTSLRDYTFEKVNGTWQSSGESESKPLNYGNLGITPADLEEALKEIKGDLPNSGILHFIIKGPNAFEVYTGRSNGPLSGSGSILDFKLNGKWRKISEGVWIS